MARILMRTMKNGSCKDEFFASGIHAEEAVDAAKRAWIKMPWEERNNCDTGIFLITVDLSAYEDETEAIEKGNWFFSIEGDLSRFIWENKSSGRLFHVDFGAFALEEKNGEWVLLAEDGKDYKVASAEDIDNIIYGTAETRQALAV